MSRDQCAQDMAQAVSNTGDNANGLSKTWNGQQLLQAQTANAQIIATFEQQASKAIGDYAAQKLQEAQAAQDQAGIDAWKEGGTARTALHALVGGLTGGVQGALGAGAASAAAPAIDQLQEQLQSALQNAGLGESTAKTIASLTGGATAASVGAAASGGTAEGAAGGFNADMNNRQLHPDQLKMIKTLARESGKDEADYQAVLCVLQNCDIDGLSGYDKNGQSIYKTGMDLYESNPEYFKNIALEIGSSALLKGNFAYAFGNFDFTKDAFGKSLDENISAARKAMELINSKPDNLGNVGIGIVKGIANNVKDAPSYSLVDEDEQRGAILGNAALIAAPLAKGAAGQLLTTIGKGWEARKVLSLDEVFASQKGSISAQQITNMGTSAALTQNEITQLTKLHTLDSAAAGVLRETVAESYFSRNGFKSLDGKCGSGNCFDGVYIKGD